MQTSKGWSLRGMRVSGVAALLLCGAWLSHSTNSAPVPPAGAPAPNPASKLEWTQFQDPSEKAFTMDVPQGWTVKGGLFRMGYSDERPMVDMTSTDRTISIRFGDVSVPTYTAIPTGAATATHG